jgi:hypothetical protein
MKNGEQKNTSIHRKREAVIRFIRKKLGKTVGRSGKVFYSSPQSLFASRYILMGYNPGGDPESVDECRIRDNLKNWRTTRENHYWQEKWNVRHKDFNTLQKRIQCLFQGLDISSATLFTSNLWFLRSRDAATIRHDPNVKKATMEIWKKFLACSPARRIIVIGVGTAREFLAELGAEQVSEKSFQTCHPRAAAVLISARMQKREYKIAAIPHLSRFSVAKDQNLIRAIKRHFK